MSDTRIEWADSTWNPITGCSPISEGCANCYAERIAKRFAGRAGYPAENPFGVVLHSEKRLSEPLRWRKPRKIFVCSMGDLFHEDVPEMWIIDVLSVIAECEHRGLGHIFMVLTKRPARMLDILAHYSTRNDVWVQTSRGCGVAPSLWPLPNLWLGVTAENQRTADERIPLLLNTPAAKRFVSCEPLLGPIDLEEQYLMSCDGCGNQHTAEWDITTKLCTDACTKRGVATSLDWIIAGGETGPGARPMHPDWARSLRDQCQAAGVPFFFKSWGEWGITEPHTYLHGGYEGQLVPYTCTDSTNRKRVGTVSYYAFPQEYNEGPGQLEVMSRMGKKRAGRLLDGREHSCWPEVGQ